MNYQWVLALRTVKNQVHGNIIKVSASIYRSREPSRICQKCKQGVQKSFKMRSLFEWYVVGVVLKSSKLFKFLDEEFVRREEHFCFKYYLACKQGRKETFKGNNCYVKNGKRRTKKHKEGKWNCLFQNIVKGYSQVLLDGIHKYFWSKKVLSKDFENNPAPSFVNRENQRMHKRKLNEKEFVLSAIAFEPAIQRDDSIFPLIPNMYYCCNKLTPISNAVSCLCSLFRYFI